MSMKNFLEQGASGGNLLFCGAGFSANSLNFRSKEIGAAYPLHQALNTALDYDYREMQIAADEFVKKFGEHKLLELLRDRYTVSKRTRDIDEILKYPWSRIYTTNYDDVISQSLTALGKPHFSANNTETPFEISQHNSEKTWVVHLHGYLKRWEPRTFAESCVLGRESYLRISSSFKWSTELRLDYERAKAIFFVGFSNSDFYLAEHLFSAEASKGKVFFINSERSAEDRELIAKQEKYGKCLAIGKEAFAKNVSDAFDTASKSKLVLHSFVPCEIPVPSKDRASVDQQEAFMISGKQDEAIHFKDILDGSHSYRAEREIISDIVGFIKADNSVALIHGGICSGKTLIFEECILNLLRQGEQVFRLNAKYYDLLPEAQNILKAFPSCILAIDNCFSLRADLHEIVKSAENAGAKVLLATRTLAYDAEEDLQTVLQDKSAFKAFDTEILSSLEGRTVIDCTDRIGGWGKLVTGQTQKLRIMERDHSSRLSGFLLGIFKSPHIRRRFKS